MPKALMLPYFLGALSNGLPYVECCAPTAEGKAVRFGGTKSIGNTSRTKRLYWSRIYSAQMQKGMPYMELAKTITINILNFCLLRETEWFHTTTLFFASQKYRESLRICA